MMIIMMMIMTMTMIIMMMMMILMTIMVMTMMMIYDLNNTDSSCFMDPEVCLLTVVLVIKPQELEIKVFTYAEDFSVIPTSKKLQFDVVTQLAPAIFISLCITASLFLSVSNENIFLSKTKKKRKGIPNVKYIRSKMFFVCLIHVQSSCKLAWGAISLQIN